MTDFTMPSLGADMEEGTLVEWLIHPGDKVARGDVVAVVETQKGAIEVEIFDTGEVIELVARVGDTLPVGAVLARIQVAGEERPEPAKPPAAPQAAVRPAAIAPEALLSPIPGGRLASPSARRRAAEAGIALAGIVGSGPSGAVLLADVEQALARPKSAPATKPGLDLAEMRRAIASAMARSKREIPHYYLAHEIDLQCSQDWLTAHNANRVPNERLLMGALLIRATVRALAKVPELNGRFETEPFTPSPEIHCGLAVAMRGGGLIAPAILDAAGKRLPELMDSMRDIVARTRSGRLRMSEITQGTITISSLGETGVDTLFGVIYPPQVALVGFGTPRLRPMAQGGTVALRTAVTVSLAADHRISDGRRGAVFLVEIERLLQEPESL